MSDIVVRKARNDYVCDCCGHIIKAGTEYLDKCIIIHGTPVKHERYHDECPDQGTSMILFRKIVASNGDLIASTPSGDKVHITGISFSFPDGHEPRALVWEWGGEHTGYHDLADIKDWIDENGERILQKS